MRRAAALFLLLAARGALAQTAFDPFGEARIDERPGARVPIDAPLLDAGGRPTTLRRIAAGRPLLLAPVLHDCPNLCGVTLAGLAQAIDGQPLRPGRDFAVVAFGIDPKESPAAAAGDLRRLRERNPSAAAGASAVVGTAASVHAVTDALGFHYAWDPRIGQYAHAAAVAVLTPDGRLSGWLYGLTPTPEAVRNAIGAAKAGTTGSWTERLLLLCYHYDPATGRYTPAVEKVLRLGALLTVTALALLVLRLRRSPA